MALFYTVPSHCDPYNGMEVGPYDASISITTDVPSAILSLCVIDSAPSASPVANLACPHIHTSRMNKKVTRSSTADSATGQLEEKHNGVN